MKQLFEARHPTVSLGFSPRSTGASEMVIYFCVLQFKVIKTKHLKGPLLIDQTLCAGLLSLLLFPPEEDYRANSLVSQGI